MNGNVFLIPFLILAFTNLLSALLILNNNASDNESKVKTYEEPRVEYQKSFKKLEVISSDPHATSIIIKEVEERREKNRSKLLPENLSKPLIVYKSN